MIPINDFKKLVNAVGDIDPASIKPADMIDAIIYKVFGYTEDQINADDGTITRRAFEMMQALKEFQNLTN